MRLRALFRLLLVALISCVVVPAYAGDAAASPASGVAVASAANVNEIGELKDRVKELEVWERQGYALEMEGQRKQVDWWLNFLAVMMAVLAVVVTVAGIAIPYVMSRKDKEIIEQDKRVIEQDKVQIKQMLEEADATLSAIRQHKEEAAETVRKAQEFVKPLQNGELFTHIPSPLTSDSSDMRNSALEKIINEAIVASEVKDANKAYAMWNAVTQINKHDESAQLNAGYWSGMLSREQHGIERVHWLKLAKQHNAEALRLNPRNFMAANNLGLLLASEAQIQAATDIAAARALWHEAGEKFQQALSVDPDLHAVANLKGAMFLFEANAIASSDVDYSRLLLTQAEQLLLAHANAAPGVVAYNLACVYGLRGDVQSCLQWLKVSQEHNTLPDCAHLRADKDMDAVRNAPEFIDWFKQVCP